jgi:hypothetical protein
LFLLRPSWTMILLFYASCWSWDDRQVLPCLVFFLLRWELMNFELFLFAWGRPWTAILPISAFCIAWDDDDRRTSLHPAIGWDGAPSFSGSEL